MLRDLTKDELSATMGGKGEALWKRGVEELSITIVEGRWRRGIALWRGEVEKIGDVMKRDGGMWLYRD